MSLRTRLFLALAALVAALVVGQWWLMTSLSRELDRELDTVALAVSGSVASFFSVDGTTVGPMDPSRALPHLRMAQLPDPSELVEIIETEDAGDRLHTVVIRRQFDVAEADECCLHTDEGPDLRWQVESQNEARDETQGKAHAVLKYSFRQETGDGDGERDTEGGGVWVGDPGADANVRIHIERAPHARFLWLVGPDSRARVALPEAGLNQKIDDFRRRMLLGSGLVLVLGLMLSAAVAHRVSAPLRRLATAAEEVGEGALGIQVDETAGDREVASTLGAFNRMSSRLAELDARARKLSALRHLGEIGDVARGLAHTLRNPLNALGLTVEELASRASDTGAEDRRSLVSSARRQIQRMDRGIRSFLVLASPAGSAAEPLDIAGLARDVALEALQDGGGRVRVAVRVDNPSDDTVDDQGARGSSLHGVEAELRAVLQALVVNAVEASPDGGEVEVWVTASHGVRVEVRDRGAGLPAEVRERLFTPHVSTKANGSGMGLFLAHRLATERYGGRLELRDRDGGGTCAVLTLGDRVDPEAEA